MAILLRNVTLKPGEPEQSLRDVVSRRFSLQRNDIVAFRIVRKGVDARKKGAVRYVYTIELRLTDEAAFVGRHGSDPDVAVAPVEEKRLFPQVRTDAPIVIVGSGPAGLFAGLRLAEYGLPATILERGKPVEERVKDVQEFWSRGVFNGESNVQFGEGGAGTFSDGKLTTRVRDANAGYVLESLVRFGAPEEILFSAKPHVGTDRLRGVIAGIREYLQERGVRMLFQKRLDDIRTVEGHIASVITSDGDEIRCGTLILAPGHSARDTYEMLSRRGIHMERKPFAVGVRVEHPQELINTIQYGRGDHAHLPTADYAVTYNNSATGRSAYSFCMCPGGTVIASSSEAEGVVTNGMSAQLRNSPFANSALVVNVTPADFPGTDILAGIEFQRRMEHAAFRVGGGSYFAPAQNLMNFLDRSASNVVSTTYRPGVKEADLADVLPEFVGATLREGIVHFDRKMRGFATTEATLIGVESRTSAPVRIVRGENLQSVSIEGLYPTGEGAGYAGGIMSAALDGIRVADAIALKTGDEEKR